MALELQRHNEALLQAAPLSEAAGSLRSLAAIVVIAPQHNAGRYPDKRDGRCGRRQSVEREEGACRHTA